MLQATMQHQMCVCAYVFVFIFFKTFLLLEILDYNVTFSEQHVWVLIFILIIYISKLFTKVENSLVKWVFFFFFF